MSPLQPRHDRAADRDDRARRQADHDAEKLVAGSNISHVDALSHIGTCRDCRWILFQHFHKVAAQLVREVEVR